MSAAVERWRRVLGTVGLGCAGGRKGSDERSEVQTNRPRGLVQLLLLLLLLLPAYI